MLIWVHNYLGQNLTISNYGYNTTIHIYLLKDTFTGIVDANKKTWLRLCNMTKQSSIKELFQSKIYLLAKDNSQNFGNV